MKADHIERDWLELVADLMQEPLTELPVETLALQLTQTLDGVGCAFSTQYPDGLVTGELYPRDESFGGHRSEIKQWRRYGAYRLHPIRLHYRRTGDGGPIQVADVPSQSISTRLRSAWYDLAGRWGCPEQLALPMPTTRPAHRAFVVGRDLPFSTRELGVTRPIWRLLAGLERQVRALSQRRPDPVAAANLRLTPRELAVLGLLADGLTATAIGHRLDIRERTVHKHLEHAYTKLDVTDRVSAVLRAHHLGVLPVPADLTRPIPTR